MIGVVIAVHNGERYLGEAIAGVRAQTAGALELVVVDNWSTDGTAALARELGARVLSTPRRSDGPASGRQIGAAALATPLLAFLDADDRWLPDKLERQLAVLEAEPGLDAVVGGVRNFFTPDREEELRGRFKLPPDVAVAWAWSGLLIRRAAFARLDWRGDRGPVETVEFFRLARERLRFGAVEGVVFERRVHGDNLSVMDRPSLHSGYLQLARAAVLARRSTP